MKSPLVELPIQTAAGEFTARYSDNGLVRLKFPPALTASQRATGGDSVRAKIRAWHRATGSALKKILAGKLVNHLPPIDWCGATEFQQSVWRELLKIPTGKTKSYGEIAQAIGKPKAVRAVGGACGANPIPVLVPCHRVLAANHKLGGFSGGLARKRSLLAREGIVGL